MCYIMQEHIPSVSMTSTSIYVFFLFLCPYVLSIPLLSILIIYPLLCTLLNFFFSSFLLLFFCVFSTHINICTSGNQLWKLHAQMPSCCHLPVMPTTRLSTNFKYILRSDFSSYMDPSCQQLVLCL